MRQKTFLEKITTWVGSGYSLVFHTLVFVVAFLLAASGEVPWDEMLLVVTTIVSLEAIYLSILIQMAVNRQAEELAEVSEDVEDIQEDIEEIQKDVDEIQEDVEEITDEDDSVEQQEKRQVVAIQQISEDVRRLLADIEQLKKK